MTQTASSVPGRGRRFGQPRASWISVDSTTVDSALLMPTSGARATQGAEDEGMTHTLHPTPRCVCAIDRERLGD